MTQGTLTKHFGSSKEPTEPAEGASPRKRKASNTADGEKSPKKSNPSPEARRSFGRANARGDLGSKATAEELADPSGTPYKVLLKVMAEGAKKYKDSAKAKGSVVLYWCRMKDLRTRDNHALSLASDKAQELGSHLVVMHVLSPGDYEAHDRSDKRIDFVLRNLKDLQQEYEELNIPLHVPTMENRKKIPEEVVAWAKEIGATHLYGNIEHEIDELRRDIRTYTLASEAGIETRFVHDFCIIEPNKLLTKQDKPYAVFSPWQRSWAALVGSDLGGYSQEYDRPKANDKKARSDSKLQSLFNKSIPESVKGFELDQETAQRMKDHWPSGAEAAEEVMRRFTSTKTREHYKGFVGHQEAGEEVPLGDNASKIRHYATNRNRVDIDGTSRISPYLAAGVISGRAALRKACEANKGKLATERGQDIGMWTQEVSWRDFYQHVLAAWPRVSMGKAFQEKYDEVVWEYDDDHLKAWTEGKTGYPFVDAGMRQAAHEGYMHNRARMTVAMFLAKDLMLDWRQGERWFMRNLIDGDFGSNNGGWQWSSSTGTDPQPYFRIFNPINQSEKSDPDGEFIRHWVPELKSVKGKAIHDPFSRLSKGEFKKLGYPEPIVDHSVARKRAIARYKTPGDAANE